ncbi:RNA-binding signal recognition particle subunit srp14 [Coemansia sp. RSA 2337]|nr:RNA-binding signal recognition particle subunit srp14 [Coemansia sp. RSA 2337]
MLLGNDEFLKALPELFAATKEVGNDYQRRAEGAKAKRKLVSDEDEAMRLLVDKLSLDETEYATLVRAVTEKRKISTLVAPVDLDEFLARYHGILVNGVDSIKKKERLRKKKATIKRQAALKAKAKLAKQQKQQAAGTTAVSSK